MTQHPVRIGVSVRPQHTTFEKMKAMWIAAEEAGVDDIYIWDHFFPLFGDDDGAHFECYSLLAALAEVTTRARIGSLVTCNSYRNPHLLADMARTIDHISGGRFILGIGSGWNEKDYREYEYDFKTAIARLHDLRDNLPVIKARLGKLNPPPIQQPLPIMIGGSGEKVTLRIVAEHADIWNGFGDPKEAGRLSGVLDDWCKKIGRDPAEIERSILTGADKALGYADDYVANGITTIMIGADANEGVPQALRDLITWRDSR